MEQGNFMAANSQFVMATHICVAIGYLEKHATPKTCENNYLVKSDIIASSVNTNPALVRRIIAKLVHANLIHSVEGRYGGFKLITTPQKISLWDIFCAIGEQDFFALNPNSPNEKCPISRNIVNIVEEIFDEVDHQVKKKFQSIHLAQLISKIEKNEMLA